MAHKKGGGTSRNGRDSNSKRLGVKAFGGKFLDKEGQNLFLEKMLGWVEIILYFQK